MNEEMKKELLEAVREVGGDELVEKVESAISVSMVTGAVQYESDEMDIACIRLPEDGETIGIAAVSERAKKYFEEVWEVERESTGIAPPDNPIHLLESVPGEWKIGSLPIKEGMHLLKRVPLPVPRAMLH